MSKILIVNLPLRIVIKAPEHVFATDIINKLNADIALDMPNVRIIDIEIKQATTKEITEWNKE